MKPLDRISDRFQHSPAARLAAYGFGLSCLSCFISELVRARLQSHLGNRLTLSDLPWKRIALGGGVLAAAGYLDRRTLPRHPQTESPPVCIPASFERHRSSASELKCDEREKTDLSLGNTSYDLHGTCIVIRVPQREIKEGQKTYLHLGKLVALFSAHREATDLNVMFLDRSGHQMKGIDCGGPQRQYLDGLCRGLVKRLQLEQFKEGDLYFPSRPIQSDEELQAYRGWGSLLFFCYQSYSSHQPCTGTHLDPSLIVAALSLSDDELNREFGQLSEASKMRLYKQLIQSQRPDLSGFKNALEAIETKDSVGAEKYISDILCLDPKKDTVDQLKQHVMPLLQRNHLPDQLGPIHAIAQGMKLLCKQPWDRVRSSTNGYHLSEKAQGISDRKRIAACLTVDELDETGSLRRLQKVVVNWIRNGATEEEIRIMMRTLTGSSGLGSGEVITLLGRNVHYNYPEIEATDSPEMRAEKELERLAMNEPKISTCFLKIAFCIPYISKLSDSELLEHFKGATLRFETFTKG